jgi:hypothetical protein
MKIRGPLVTLGAVAALGAGIWLVNVSQQEPEPAPSSPPHAEATTTTATPAPQPPAPPTPAPVVFPPKADYVGEIPTANGNLTLEITVDGNKAIAYTCDGNAIESWLWGSAVNGVVTLASKDKTNRLDGRLEGTAVVGTLFIGEQKWDFKADAAQPPAGLYVYEEAGVRTSWIIDSNGSVTGVQRQPDGSTGRAPGLSLDATAVINGRTVKATRVEGDSVV